MIPAYFSELFPPVAAFPDSEVIAGFSQRDVYLPFAIEFHFCAVQEQLKDTGASKHHREI
jgi:hypothetical protein